MQQHVHQEQHVYESNAEPWKTTRDSHSATMGSCQGLTGSTQDTRQLAQLHHRCANTANTNETRCTMGTRCTRCDTIVSLHSWANSLPVTRCPRTQLSHAFMEIVSLIISSITSSIITSFSTFCVCYGDTGCGIIIAPICTCAKSIARALALSGASANKAAAGNHCQKKGSKDNSGAETRDVHRRVGTG